MCKITDVSRTLGEYMLNGWILTDDSCPTTGCSVPMMRSPNGIMPVQHFCASCDANPDTGNPMPKPLVDSSPSISSSSHISRSSTPATDVSSSLSSPTFAPPAETEESLLRRRQSDSASAEIGKRLLKGWAMLGEECPNSRCFGVPLVRPPKPGGGKDPRKECVICGTVYVSEHDANGWERLVTMDFSRQTRVTGSSDAPTTSGLAVRDESKSVGRDQTPQATKFPKLPGSPVLDRSKAFLTEFSQAYPRTMHLSGRSTTLAVLEATAVSLETTLLALSERLHDLGQTVTDPSLISVTADAISKVTLALTQVKQLRWSESQQERLL